MSKQIKTKQQNKHILKWLILVLLVSVFYTPLTKAQLYNDEESAKNNLFSASNLDLVLKSKDLNIGGIPHNKNGDLDGWYPGTNGENIFYVSNEGDLPFVYGLKINTIKNLSNENKKLCESMNLKVDYLYTDENNENKEKKVYEGNLLDFEIAYNESNLDFNHMFLPADPQIKHSYKFNVELPIDQNDSELAGKKCVIEVISFAWQKELLPETGFWDEEALVQKIQSADWDHVLINEVMWSGSTVSSEDEWIELYNDTDEAIDISGWKIKNGAGSDDENTDNTDESELVLPEGSVISANGYFLISNFDSDSQNSALANNINVDVVTTKIDLDDDGENLVLTDPFGNTIDGIKTKKDDGGWQDGKNESNKMSMERNNVSSTGWHRCDEDESSECNDTQFWDEEGFNYGTPNSENMSKGDPSEKLIEENILLTEPLICVDPNTTNSDSEPLITPIPFESQEPDTNLPESPIVETDGILPLETNTEQNEESIETETTSDINSTENISSNEITESVDLQESTVENSGGSL